MRFNLLLLLLFIEAILSDVLAITVHDNENLLIKSTISNQHINAFAEDNIGYMWIGTAKGLCKYNGYEYQYYYHDPQKLNTLPSDFITGLYLDSRNQLWVTTDNGACRYNYDTDNFSALRYEDITRRASLEYGCIEAGSNLYMYGVYGVKIVDRERLKLIANETTSPYLVQTMIEDDYSHLWIWGQKEQPVNGLVCLDKSLSNPISIKIDPTINILCSYKTRNGELWFGTNRGIMVIDPYKKVQIESETLKAPLSQIAQLQVTFFLAVDENNVFIGTENRGLFLYNFKRDELKHVSQSQYFNDNTSTHVTCCYRDRGHNLWLGTFDKGYFLHPRIPKKFNNDYGVNSHFDGKFVTRVAEDRECNLWVGTRYDGVIYYDRKTKKTVTYNCHNFKPLGLSNSNLIESLYIDSNKNLWIANGSYLTWCKIVGGNIVDYKVYNTGFGISTIAEDDYKRVWTGSSVGEITLYDIEHVRPVVKVPLQQKLNNITKIIKLSSGEMLFSNYGQGIYFANPKTLKVKKMATFENLSQYIDRAIFLYEASDAKIWVGTYGRGLIEYSRSTGTSQVYMPRNGLSSNDVLAIVEDSNKNIWMSTSYGVSTLNVWNKTFINYFDYDGTGGNQFHEKAVLKSQNGMIYFGGNHGLTYFDPLDRADMINDIPVVLEDLKILNISEPIGGPHGVLGRHISQTKLITLNHKQNIFSIDYSGIEPVASKKIKYAYMLKNLDKEWNYVDGFRRATYSNLYPGVYTFYVKAQNPDGTWTHNPTALTICIKAAPWFSWVAIVCYFVLVLIVIIVWMRIYLRFKLDKERIELIERKRLYESNMTDLKINFFTNISHELRTPLSMIYGPVKKLMDPNIDRATNDYLLQLVDYNVTNLLRLIDQTMDFVKLESDSSALAISHVDIEALCMALINNYSYFAERKNIEVRLEMLCPKCSVSADEDKLNKIISNLLSNALKYTPDDGHVAIEIDIVDKPTTQFKLNVEADKFLSVKVIDDGVGMSNDDLKHLFIRYKRFASKDSHSKTVSGKGIGLNYVRQLVEKHKGGIVADLREPKGMVFSFVIPVDRSVYSVNELVQTLPQSETQGCVTSQIYSEIPVELSEDRHTILIVDDNAELRTFLSYLLKDKYNVVLACDGLDGYNKCCETNVELVLSDVLMPQMDGYELCATIKNDPNLCHIPVVLLTAKTMDDNHIEGYSHGADVYVNKPFNPKLLETIIQNVFVNIERRSAMIVQGVDPVLQTEPDELKQLNPLDQKFLERLYAYIDSDLSNSNLNVNVLGRELAFSRTSFYRKIKALTGHSPNDFLRRYRLNKAAELLKRNEYSINEIVDMTGFGTHSHFSACFKKQFGVNPKDYVDK